jgi:hypothetical protein
MLLFLKYVFPVVCISFWVCTNLIRQHCSQIAEFGPNNSKQNIFGREKLGAVKVPHLPKCGRKQAGKNLLQL